MNIKLSNSELIELKKLLSSKDIKSIKGINFDILNNIIRSFEQDDNIKLFVDGAADLHSKQAGIGGVIYRNDEELFSFSENIGSATNNEAEYKALIRGLKETINLNLLNIDIYADSELVVRQIKGEYKVKNDRMQVLNKEVIKLLDQVGLWSIAHIPREKNTIADKLSKEGMRNKL